MAGSEEARPAGGGVPGPWPRPLSSACILLNRISSHWQLLPPAGETCPRRVLLVHCHPRASSFSAACADAVATSLVEAGHEVRWRTLYQYESETVPEGLRTGSPYVSLPSPQAPLSTSSTSGFSPMLTAEERGGYYSIAERGAEVLAPEVAEAVEDLRWAQDLILVYPTWWFNFPAALKGWVDRVFLPHVAFRLPGKHGVHGEVAATGLEPLLTNIERVGVVTTYGASRLVVTAAGDNGRRMISNGLRPLFASNCVVMWNGLHEMDTTTPDERQRFLRQIRERYRAL